MAWFGVRGIGSLYYLMYAISHGLEQALALQILSITLIVITSYSIHYTKLYDGGRCAGCRSG